MTLEVEEVEGIVSLEDILIVVLVGAETLLNVGFLEQWFVRTTETESTVLHNLSAISGDAKLPHSPLIIFIIIIENTKICTNVQMLIW